MKLPRKLAAVAAAAILCAEIAHAAETAKADTQPKTAKAALTRESKQGKYLILLLADGKVDDMRKGALAAMRGIEAKADFFELPKASPEWQDLADRYGVDRLSLPAVLAISPTGVITRSFPQTPSADELKGALLSRTMVKIVQALRAQRAVLLTFTNATFADHKEVVAAVKEFAADFKDMTTVVLADPKGESAVATRCGLSPVTKDSVLVIVLNGYFAGQVKSPRAKADVAKAFELASRRAGCGSGGCSSGGCK